MAEVNAESVVRTREAMPSQRPAAPVSQAAVVFTDGVVTRICLMTPPLQPLPEQEPPAMLAVGTEDEVHVEWREALRMGRLMVLEALVPGYRSVGTVLLNPAVVESVYTEATDVTIERRDERV